MSKAGSAAKVKLNSFHDLFGASDMTEGTDQVQEIPLLDLYEFRGHPFKVLDDESKGCRRRYRKAYATKGKGKKKKPYKKFEVFIFIPNFIPNML